VITTSQVEQNGREWINSARQRLDQTRLDHQPLTPMESPPDDGSEASRRAVEDDSLRPGDIVSTNRGLFVFKGRSSAEHSLNEFVSLRDWDDIRWRTISA
jgi:hypothetical protein